MKSATRRGARGQPRRVTLAPTGGQDAVGGVGAGVSFASGPLPGKSWPPRPPSRAPRNPLWTASASSEPSVRSVPSAMAWLSVGATVVPIYQTNSADECQYVLENSDAVAVVVEDDEQLEKIRRVRDRCPKLEHVIRMTGESGDAISFEQLAARGAERRRSRPGRSATAPSRPTTSARSSTRRARPARPRAA